MDARSKVKRILFFEDPLQVEGYLKKIVRPCEEDLCIALNPNTYLSLKSKNLNCSNTLPYFSNDSHALALSRSKSLIEWLTAHLSCSLGDMNALESLKNIFVFYLRYSIHYCLFNLEIILNAIEVHRPEIVAVVSLRHEERVLSLYVQPPEMYLMFLVQRIARLRNLKFEKIQIERSLSLKNYYCSRIASFLRCVWGHLRLRIFGILGSKDMILVSTPLYQMDSLKKEYQKKYVNFKFQYLKGCPIWGSDIPNIFIQLFFKKDIKRVFLQRQEFNSIKDKISSERLFSYRSVFFGDMIGWKIQNNLSHYVMGLSMWAQELKYFLDRSNPKAFISNGVRDDDTILAELCKKKDIHAIFISHGSHVKPKNELEAIEWGEHGNLLMRAPYSHIALQSPLAEEYAKAFSIKAKTIRTGPLIWGKSVPLQYKRGGAYLIIHAGTPKMVNTLRFHVYETPDEYIQTLQELAGAVEMLPNMILIIKFRPILEISENTLRQLIPTSPRIKIDIESAISTLLSKADLVVSFSSTVIEEALQNKIPVLLYGGKGRYQHIAGEEIIPSRNITRSPIYFIKECQYVSSGIKRILNVHSEGLSNSDIYSPYIYNVQDRSCIFNEKI